MPKVRETPWRKWIAAFAGIVLFLKTMAFALSKVMSVVKSEVQARGSDTNLVLGLADRRKGNR
jgi:hypothetical protein